VTALGRSQTFTNVWLAEKQALARREIQCSRVAAFGAELDEIAPVELRNNRVRNRSANAFWLPVLRVLMTSST
jgi:hypothetical protein